MSGPLGATRHFASLLSLPRTSAGPMRDAVRRWVGSRGGRTPAFRIREPPCPRRESATDTRLDGDEMAADADDRDAGHAFETYMSRR